MKQLWNWFRRGRLESSLDRELQYHVDRRTADLIQSGVPEGQARRQAALEVGGLTQVKEEVRDVWLTRWLRDLAYDARYSVRAFLRSPSFSATAVLSLALGIGATTAIYSLVDQVVLRPLPVRHPERLVLVNWEGDMVASGFGTMNLLSYPLYRELQAQSRFFDGVFCRAAIGVTLSIGNTPQPVGAEVVSGSYFPVLGVSAAMGRLLDENDDRAPGASPVVVLGHDFWRTQLGGDPNVIGRKLMVNQIPMEVVGVASPSFRGIDVGQIPSLWIPASMSPQIMPSVTGLLSRRRRWMQILGRLQPGVSLQQAQTGLLPWFKTMLDEDLRRPEFPRVTPDRLQRYQASWLSLAPASQGHSPLRRRLAEPLWVLMTTTGVLLALACLNVAGLFLARGSARGREIGTRLALGASRGRIGRQLLADSVLLSLIGGGLGVALAPLALRALIAFLPKENTSHALESSIDGRLLLFAFLISVAAGVLSGIAPALNAGRASLISSLRERAASVGGVRLRKLIVTAQIAFSLILIVGAVLFVRTLTGLVTMGPGFDTANVVSFGVAPMVNGHSPADSTRIIRRIYEEIREVPVTQAAGFVGNQFLNGGSWNQPLTIQAGERIVTDRLTRLNSVTPGFFAALGIRLIAGREFDARDSRPVGENGFRSAIVTEMFVKRHLAGRNPLGARLALSVAPDAKPDIEIVGVVQDFHYRGLREDWEQAFFPILEDESPGAHFYVKVRGGPEQAMQPLRDAIRKVDPALSFIYYRTVDEQVERSLNNERILATLSAAFGGLALLLSLVGLYGVMSFVVTQRTREIGIRIALGATRNAAIWLVLRDALWMVLGGTAIALPAIAALGRLVESQLFGVKATDPTAITMAGLLLASAALGATLIPAYRAARLDPTEALRLD